LLKASEIEYTGNIPNWLIIMQSIAGRLGKYNAVPMSAFEVVSDKRINAAVLLREGAQPLVIWREKTCRIIETQHTIKSIVQWVETGVYWLPKLGRMYLIADGTAQEVGTNSATRLIFRQHKQGGWWG